MQSVATEAHTVGAWRACEHGDAINYEGMLDATGHNAVRTMVEFAAQSGFLADSAELPDSAPWFGTLDVYDADGTRIQDYLIPSDEAWQWWRQAASLHPTDWDCDTCDVR